MMPPKKRKPPKKMSRTRSLSLTEMAGQSMEAVDPELFLWCQGVYYAAASMAMPVQNPEYTKVPLDERGGFVGSHGESKRFAARVVGEPRCENHVALVCEIDAPARLRTCR
jgi:hypothetical protein